MIGKVTTTGNSVDKRIIQFRKELKQHFLPGQSIKIEGFGELKGLSGVARIPQSKQAINVIRDVKGNSIMSKFFAEFLGEEVDIIPPESENGIYKINLVSI